MDAEEQNFTMDNGAFCQLGPHAKHPCVQVDTQVQPGGVRVSALNVVLFLGRVCCAAGYFVYVSVLDRLVRVCRVLARSAGASECLPSNVYCLLLEYLLAFPMEQSSYAYYAVQLYVERLSPFRDVIYASAARQG